MDKEQKQCWDKLKEVPKTPEEKEKEISKLLQAWYTARTRKRGNQND